MHLSRLRRESPLRGLLRRHRPRSWIRLRTILKCPRCGALFHARVGPAGAISLMCDGCRSPRQ